MRGQRILHQTLEYPAQEPFVLMTARYADVDHPFITNSHWHEELEIVYIL